MSGALAAPRALRAAVVGCGDISAVHLDALVGAGVPVAAVVDPDLEKARARGEQVGAPAYADLAAALAAEEIDVVHVCTPHDQHVPVALAALAAGKHVLTEKPLAHTLPEALRLADAARASGTTVGVCFQNRYNTTSRALHDVVTSGELGPVLSASATVAWSRTEAYYGAKPWAGQKERSGGGALINQAIHTLDLLLWLLGPVASVHGRAQTLLPIPGVDVEDTAILALDHEAGVRSAMWATNTGGGNAPVTLDVVCEGGTASLRGDLVIRPTDGAERVVTEAAATGARAYWGLSHATLIADFYDHARQGRPFWIDADVALTSQQVLDAVYAGS